VNTFKLLEDYVQLRTGDCPQFPLIVEQGMNTVSGEVPYKLKLAIVVSELITFVSHIRKPIKLYDGTLVPVNMITFALSASGTSKDKTLNAVRKALQGGYNTLEEVRKEAAESRAKDAAIATTGSVNSWRQYYDEPKPLQAGLGTAEGLIHHFSEIASSGVGAGSVMSSEIGSELHTNSSMTEIIKTVSVAYDLGNIPMKLIKSAENQTKEVKGFPVNALFFGAQEALLFNNEIKGKFKLAFNTQLARRSLFSFTPESPAKLKIESIDELYKYREEERARVIEAQSVVSKQTDELLADSTNKPLELSPEANKLFDVYLEYNALRSENVSNKYPITKLSQRHKQWLALKLGGAYAILDRSEYVTEKHYATAINTVEMLTPDMEKFEKELVKEPYEQLVDMCKYNAEEGSFFISLHELRKMSYISGTGSAKAKVDDLVVMANSCDEHGSYSAVDNGIQYKEIIKTDKVGVSYIIFSSALEDEVFKEYASKNCSKGYEFYETEFHELALLLQENATYTPFMFEGGVRGKEHLRGGAKFLVLDVDKSFLTYKEAHVLLNRYNHHIVQTSDPKNEFKFRVLLELDSMVNVDEFLWKALLEVIGDELGLVVDPLPQSQIFFSFANREILTQLEGETLPSKMLINRAAEVIKDAPKPPSTLPDKVKSQRLEDPKETFMFAYSAENGERSIKLYRALAYAIDLGADKEYLVKLAHEINDYWLAPMDKVRLERTLLNPALRRLG
jgi:hypothetical protein